MVIGGKLMRIECSDAKITLTFERSPEQRAAATLHMLFMGGFAAFLLYYAVYGLLYAPISRSLPVALFFVAGAAFAVWNGSTSLLDPDYTTAFDLKARSVTVTESSVITRQRGPVSFDDIIGLGTRVGNENKTRSVIAELALANGERWKLGSDWIWLRPVSASDIPRLIARLRKATGLPREDSD